MSLASHRPRRSAREGGGPTGTQSHPRGVPDAPRAEHPTLHRLHSPHGRATARSSLVRQSCSTSILYTARGLLIETTTNKLNWGFAPATIHSRILPRRKSMRVSNRKVYLC